MKVEWKLMIQTHSLEWFEQEVSRHLSEGWELAGPLIAAENVSRTQPIMRRCAEEFKEEPAAPAKKLVNKGGYMYPSREERFGRMGKQYA